jgi:hypothetical protein
VDSEAEIPLTPPTGIFSGDSVTITAEPAEGGILFTASGPNSPGVVTEFALHKLPNFRRALGKAFTTAGFHAFQPEPLSNLLPLDPGIYGVAYRFVQSSTGRHGMELVVGVVRL